MSTGNQEFGETMKCSRVGNSVLW